MEPTTVLIVGAGPTGLAMGIELARQGVPFRLVEKAAEPTRWSQALVVQARTLEQFERYGIADEAVARGRILRHAELVSEGKTIVSFELDRIPGRYPFVLFLPQSQTERLMAEHLSSIGGRIERGVELTSFVNGPAGVEARLRHADGRAEVAWFRWVVGCDGAHSAVRHGLDVPFEGDTVGLSFLLGDLELDGDRVPGDELRIYLHRGDVVFFGRLRERVWRVILVEHGRDWADTTPDLSDFQRMIDRVVGPGIRVVGSEWVSPYRVNQRKARHYRVASAFLAGDACHIHSPVAGQGMNTGIQDAANLGWKMGAVERGAPEALLDTYETERGAVGDALLKQTSRGLALATAESRVAEWLRDVVARTATGVEWVQDALLGFISETAIAYPESPIAVDRGGMGEVRAGHRVPNPDVPGGGRLLDGLRGGRQLVLMGTRGRPVEVRGEPYAFESVDVTQDELRRVVGDVGRYLVVRPDGYAGFLGGEGDLPALEEYARMTGLERSSR
jgi:2-polyprenyl-6-methoxyphenol hydroxylase-like FAD-dependent oxidoreductase